MSEFPPYKAKRSRRSQYSNPENQWEAEKRQPSPTQRLFRRVRLITLVLLIGLAGIVGGLVLRSNRANTSRASLTGTPPPPQIEAIAPPETPGQKSEAAIALIKSFFGIHNPTHRLPLIFDPENEQSNLLEYYGSRARTDPTGIHNHKVTGVLDKGREILIVTFNDQDNRLWAAPVEWHTNGYRLHWGSMTGYGETSWTDLVARKPESPSRMRVNIYRPDSTATGLTPAGHEYVLLTHPELPRPLGALLGNSESLLPLRQSPPNTDIPAYVIIQWQDFGPAGQWPVITGLIHRNWIR